MNRGYYAKLLGQYRSFFELNYDQDRPFSTSLILREKESQNRKFKLKSSMITENERNEMGDVGSVNSDGSYMQFDYKDDEKRYKFKLKENKISGLYAVTPEATSKKTYYRNEIYGYTHEFGVEAAFEPKLLWNFYGSDKWNVFARAQYEKVCFNQLKVGFEGETSAENKLDSLIPNKVQYNNATIFRNGFFFGGNLDFLIQEKKPEIFEKIAGYGCENKLIFAKHISKGFVNEEGRVEAGGLTIIQNDETMDQMGVGVNYAIESKESVFTAGFGRTFKSTDMELKAKVENTRVIGSFSFKLTDRLRLNMTESVDVVNYAKNPKDGDSHKYKMGVNLIYTDLF